MNKKKHMLPLIFLVYSMCSNAQYKNSVEISYNIIGGHLKDINFSPLIYTIKANTFGLNYSHQNPQGKNFTELQFDYGQGEITTKVSDFFTTNITLVNINITQLRKISVTKNEKLATYLGAQYQSKTQLLSWRMFESYSFAASYGLGIKGLAIYRFNKKHSLQTSIALPMVGLIVRPPYAGNDDYITANGEDKLKVLTHGKIASLNEYIAVDWQTNYKYNISKRFDAQLKYSMNFQQYNIPKKAILLQNNISLGINYKF